MRRALLSLICLAVMPCLLLSQTAAPTQTPDGCRKLASDSFTVTYRAAQAAAKQPGGKAVDGTALMATRAAVEKACLAPFKIATTPDSMLLALAAAYHDVGLDSLAAAATNKRIRGPGLSERNVAEALNTMIGILTKPDPIKLGSVERYVTRLDGLSDSVLDQKIKAHATINGEYRYLDIDERIRHHAEVIIAMGKRLKVAAVNAYVILGAYTDLAEVYGDLGQTDSALLVLDQARVDHPEVPAAGFAQIVGAERARYELVGKPAPALEATHWLNADSTMRVVNPAGKVTLIEFTAHWCVPCRNSYPSMVTMNQQFAARGVRFLFATDFYGYVGTKRNLDHAAELIADEEYYGGEHGLHFPIAVEDIVARRPGESFVPLPNNDHYKVGGIPQVVIIDRNGIIRRIITGWDRGNERRIPALLATLVAEKAATP